MGDGDDDEAKRMREMMESLRMAKEELAALGGELHNVEDLCHKVDSQSVSVAHRVNEASPHDHAMLHDIHTQFEADKKKRQDVHERVLAQARQFEDDGWTKIEAQLAEYEAYRSELKCQQMEQHKKEIAKLAAPAPFRGLQRRQSLPNEAPSKGQHPRQEGMPPEHSKDDAEPEAVVMDPEEAVRRHQEVMKWKAELWEDRKRRLGLRGEDAGRSLSPQRHNTNRAASRRDHMTTVFTEATVHKLGMDLLFQDALCPKVQQMQVTIKYPSQHAMHSVLPHSAKEIDPTQFSQNRHSTVLVTGSLTEETTHLGALDLNTYARIILAEAAIEEYQWEKWEAGVEESIRDQLDQMHIAMQAAENARLVSEGKARAPAPPTDPPAAPEVPNLGLASLGLGILGKPILPVRIPRVPPLSLHKLPSLDQRANSASARECRPSASVSQSSSASATVSPSSSPERPAPKTDRLGSTPERMATEQEGKPQVSSTWMMEQHAAQTRRRIRIAQYKSQLHNLNFTTRIDDSESDVTETGSASSSHRSFDGNIHEWPVEPQRERSFDHPLAWSAQQNPKTARF